MIEVRLTWAEVVLAANAGAMRRINAMKNNRPHRDGGKDETGWDSNINGAIAEMAVAKHYGIFWDVSVGITSNSDVGPLEVRSKKSTQWGMVIKPNDKDGAYVSVCIQTPICILTGWFPSADAKRQDWLKQPEGRPPMYFVPREMLRDLNELSFSRSSNGKTPGC